MDESEEHSGSSSEDEGEARDVVKANDFRLSQMRRGAQKRGGQSKLKARYSGLQSYGEMMRAHGLERMQDGLRKLLSLHSAAELSSLCGCLHLKVQQKGATSIDQILRWASETEEINEDKMGKILNFMWEGALWEYLHSIGHPVHSMLPDPKATILNIWISGGLLESSHAFIPHFVAREVKKRYEWVTSDDIRSRLEKLRAVQEAAKYAERKVVSDHDYTNILTYFGQMGELRRQENAFREYLISELEIARSRVDSCADTAKINRQQIKEGEMHFIAVAEALNLKLAYSEAACEHLMGERLLVERDLQRLSSIVDSYSEAEFNREVSGGGTVMAQSFAEERSACKAVRHLHKKMQNYRSARNLSDTALRDRARGHVEEIDRLEIAVRELEGDLNDKMNECEALEARALRAEAELRKAARMLSKAELRSAVSVDQSWGSALRYAAKVGEVEQVMRKVKPVIVACLNHRRNPLLVDLCKMLLDKLPLTSSRDEYTSIMNCHYMGIEDVGSQALRKAKPSKADSFETSSTSGSPGKKTAKAGASSKGKKPGSSSSSGKKKSDNDTVKSKASVSSKNSSPSKASATPKKAPAAAATPKKAAPAPASPTKKATPSAKKK